MLYILCYNSNIIIHTHYILQISYIKIITIIHFTNILQYDYCNVKYLFKKISTYCIFLTFLKFFIVFDFKRAVYCFYIIYFLYFSALYSIYKIV